MTLALFPGSFDPFHLGHLAIVEWAAGSFDEVVVAVLGNPEKPSGMYTPDTRVELASLATAHLANVRCLNFRGITGDLAKQEHADVIIRSAHKDADLERSLAVLNKFMSQGVPTEFAPAVPALEHISSTVVRDLLVTGRVEAAAEMVPPGMREALGTAARIEGPQPAARPGAGPMTAGRRVEPTRVASVQDAPVFLDRDESLDKALSLIELAAGEGARIVLFPQAFLPGYPEWIWWSPPHEETAAAQLGTLFDNAVVIGSAVTQVLALAAKRHGAYVSIGVSERASNGLFSAQLLFSPAGALESVQRLMSPAGGERGVWGRGGLADAPVVETPFGRIGTLVGGDAYRPLARAALQSQGVDLLLVPTRDPSDVWPSSMRHMSREAHVFAVGANQSAGSSTLEPPDVPRGPGPGRGLVTGPDGEVLATGPQGGLLLSSEIDVNEARRLRHRLDPGGQDARPDLFELRIHTSAPPATEPL